jgi:hypothetical protein
MSQPISPEEQVMQKINEVPDVLCSLCEKPKHPVLFAPSELKRKSPRCRMCKANGDSNAC